MNRLYIIAAVFISAGVLFTGCGEGDSSGTNINDVERPSDVAGLNVTDTGDGYVTLGWNAASDNVGVAGYRITAVEISVTRDVGNVTSYTWSGLLNGTTYTFSIVAYDASDNTSANPDTATGTPQEPDTDPPSEVTNPNGTGGWHDAVAQDYIELNLWWTASSSTDVSHYLLSISSDGGTTYDMLADFNIGNITTLTVPNAAGPVTSGDLVWDNATYIFTMDKEYTILVAAVDTSGNQSSGVTFTVTPTESQDTTPPEAVRNLDADPDDQSVILDWDEPLPVGDAASYHIYYRTPVDDDATAWTSFGSTTALTETVTGLTNGTTYEFMVCAVDGSGNEHPGGSTADRTDDTYGGEPSSPPYQDKITAIPTSDSILCIPNIKGGVFREAQLSAQDIVFSVSTLQSGLLTTDANTEVYYTLDGSEIDTSNFTIDNTHGYFTFDTATNPDVVTEVTTGYLYYITIDFDPGAGPAQQDYSTGTNVDQISDNSLRPGGGADHIVLKLLVKAPGDSSRISRETYLIYSPDSAHDYRVFSGMRELRSGTTATYIEQGNTAGDVVFIGGSLLGVPLGTAERYRLSFEHFENVLAPGASTPTMANTRKDHVAVLLTDGITILTTGGFDPSDFTAPADGVNNPTLGLRSVELFAGNAALNADGFTGAGAPMDEPRRFHTVTRLYNGSLLVTGGLSGQTNLYGSIAGPFQAQNLDPSRTKLESDPGQIDPTVNPMNSSDIGSVVEMLSGGSVVQQGILTNFNWNDGATPPHYDLTISGLSSDINTNDDYRIINMSTVDAEYFTAAGAPDGVADPSDLNYARYGHTATLLQDGTVFIAGGLYDYQNDPDNDFEYLPEIFDPVAGDFTLLTGSNQRLSGTRYFHTATLLQDGKVLLTGGLKNGDYAFRSAGYKGANLISTAELYDPYTETVTKVGNMTKTRFMHSATLLQSGKVLICGGYISVTDQGVPVYDNTAETYDPETQKFSSTGLMLTPRAQCAAQVIKDRTSEIYGNVVVGGGASNLLAELYDENTGLFSATAHGVSDDRYIGSVSTPLNDGTVLITGGQTDAYFKSGKKVVGQYLKTAEVYDTSRVKFTRSAGAMSKERRHHTGTLLQDGKVLITGGENAGGGLTSADIYDPSDGIFTSTASMLEPRYKHSATLLKDGTVLIVGGANKLGSLQSCEIYDPSTGQFNSTASMDVPRYDHTATLLANGWVMITGGEGIDSTSVEFYNPSIGDFVASPNVDAMLNGRDGHTAVQPVYAIGKARFENGQTAVVGSNGSSFGLADTDWNGVVSPVKDGDIIMSVEDNVPYVIDTVNGANSITLLTAYQGTSTVDKLTGGNSADGFEDYVILSQDVYITGGEVLDTSTEVFDFDAGDDEWPASDPNDYVFIAGNALNSGRYGHTMTALADGRLLITGGRNLVNGEYTTLVDPEIDFDDDTWAGNTSALDSFEWKFHAGFRLLNQTVILIRGHSAQVFHTN